MPIRVVARIRPILESDTESDVVVHPVSADDNGIAKSIKVYSPRDEGEELEFALDGVYSHKVSQEVFFNSEAHADAKHLFQGKDVTYIAYGSSGTGKTHTIRGGLKLEDRGLIPRLMSNIYRRSKKAVKDSGGQKSVRIILSYFEIYRDEIYDLLNPTENRSGRGLRINDHQNAMHIVGLTEKECASVKDFSKIYIDANKSRAIAATKLNCHSSRSHALLRVKIVQSVSGEERISFASVVDLAGSEDSRKADTSQEALVEAAAINKSLFVLTQCIDAISRGDKRVPFRESKLTRVMCLGQKPKAHTTMILNLAPVRSCHLDSISSLNISSKTKRIEAREIENELVFKQLPRANSGLGDSKRRALRPLADVPRLKNTNLTKPAATNTPEGTTEAPAPPAKMFIVFKDNKSPSKARRARTSLANMTNTTPMVHRVGGRSPGKRIFDTKSPSKHRQPLRVRSTAVSRHDDGYDVGREDELQEGMRYISQTKQKCLMATDKCAGKARVRPVDARNRVGLDASKIAGPMNGPVPSDFGTRRSRDADATASRLPVAKATMAHGRRPLGNAVRHDRPLGMSQSLSLAATPAVDLSRTEIQKPLQVRAALRA
ncbi:kinesin family member 22 [Ceratocystis lukuohia]|uniref:Kinesin family member 22 n=1 Tax=Ceratocystis lukuohia TaxID=2019550 RepID=A0ABR4MRG8_9PEZI